MLTTDDLKFAVDDARRRVAADTDLTLANDRTSLSLMQMCVTIGAGAFSGAAYLYFSAPQYPRQLSVGLVVLGLVVSSAAICALASTWSGSITLPGRDASFWQWADSEGVTADDAYRAYLSNIALKQPTILRRGEMSFRLGLAAKSLFAVAPLFGVVAAFIAGFV